MKKLNNTKILVTGGDIRDLDTCKKFEYCDLGH